MTDKITESVARAMAGTQDDNWDECYLFIADANCTLETAREAYREMARAAIQAYQYAVASEAVCKVDASYGNGMLLAAFNVKSLPVGTLLFAAPPSPEAAQ